jgi:nicotinate phosphoribosyltransferase
MAHSFIQTHDEELVAFEHFARSHPRGTTLLIDTYDTETAAQALIPLQRQLSSEGISIQAVRIDSGDLGEHARRVRAILDSGGARDIKIFASGNLDEYAVQALLDAGAPIDGFGVGTRMNTSADHPYFDCAYKLQEYAGVARRKRSEGKATWPGRKQVFRRFDATGDGRRMTGDTLSLEIDNVEGMPLLGRIMSGGHRMVPSPSLAEVREQARRQLASLPPSLRCLDAAPPYAVDVSEPLRELARRVDLRRC